MVLRVGEGFPMSMNLRLSSTTGPNQNKASCSLYQTPTLVTEAALASNDPKAVYFAWLDGVQ